MGRSWREPALQSLPHSLRRRDAYTYTHMACSHTHGTFTHIARSHAQMACARSRGAHTHSTLTLTGSQWCHGYQQLGGQRAVCKAPPPRAHPPGHIPQSVSSSAQDVVNTHPGLAFLKEASEFHSRYITTVSTWPGPPPPDPALPSLCRTGLACGRGAWGGGCCGLARSLKPREAVCPGAGCPACRGLATQPPHTSEDGLGWGPGPAPTSGAPPALGTPAGCTRGCCDRGRARVCCVSARGVRTPSCPGSPRQPLGSRGREGARRCEREPGARGRAHVRLCVPLQASCPHGRGQAETGRPHLAFRAEPGGQPRLVLQSRR